MYSSNDLLPVNWCIGGRQCLDSTIFVLLIILLSWQILFRLKTALNLRRTAWLNSINLRAESAFDIDMLLEKSLICVLTQ